MIQALIIFNDETYEPMAWHATLLYWAVILIAVLVNILGISVFPHIETLAFIFHVCFFFVLLVPLVYLSPQSTARFRLCGLRELRRLEERRTIMVHWIAHIGMVFRW